MLNKNHLWAETRNLKNFAKINMSVVLKIKLNRYHCTLRVIKSGLRNL